MNESVEPVAEVVEDRMTRGHIRIWTNPKGERQWSVTCPVGTSRDELEEARVVAEAMARELDHPV